MESWFRTTTVVVVVVVVGLCAKKIPDAASERWTILVGTCRGLHLHNRSFRMLRSVCGVFVSYLVCTCIGNDYSFIVIIWDQVMILREKPPLFWGTHPVPTPRAVGRDFSTIFADLPCVSCLPTLR